MHTSFVILGRVNLEWRSQGATQGGQRSLPRRQVNVGEDTELVVVQPPHYGNGDVLLWLLSDCPKWELSNTTFPAHCAPTDLYTHTSITCHLCAHTRVQRFTCLNIYLHTCPHVSLSIWPSVHLHSWKTMYLLTCAHT